MPPIAKTLPGFENTGWFGIVAPTGTPKEIIEKVYQDTKKALESTEMKARFYVQGLAPVGNTPEEMGARDEGGDARSGRAWCSERKITGEVKVDLQQVEEAAKELYIRALKLLPPDVKQGFDRLAAGETDAGAKRVLGTMMKNITVAEDQRQPAVPGHRHPDLQRAHRPRRRGGRLRPEGGDPARLRALDARVLRSARRSCIRPRA